MIAQARFHGWRPAFRGTPATFPSPFGAFHAPAAEEYGISGGPTIACERATKDVKKWLARLDKPGMYPDALTKYQAALDAQASHCSIVNDFVDPTTSVSNTQYQKDQLATKRRAAEAAARAQGQTLLAATQGAPFPWKSVGIGAGGLAAAGLLLYLVTR